MKIGAVVILYHPDEEVINNIVSYSKFCQKIFVFDNTDPLKNNFIKLIKAIPNCIYLNDGENKGIATRLNQAALLATEHSFDWLLTMDQDSSFDNIEKYINCCFNYHQKDKVAVFGVQHEHISMKSDQCNALPVKQIITSGSLLNLNLYQHIGHFNEDLFIDQVDFDYCYRAIQNNFQLIRFDNVFLNHSIGKSTIHRSPKYFKIVKRSLHSPVRIYYMVRNFLYMKYKYENEFKKEITLSKLDLMIRIKNHILYSPDRYHVIKHIALGIQHYRSKRMGKL